jgi:hypothetical protein
LISCTNLLRDINQVHTHTNKHACFERLNMTAKHTQTRTYLSANHSKHNLDTSQAHTHEQI